VSAKYPPHDEVVIPEMEWRASRVDADLVLFCSERGADMEGLATITTINGVGRPST
jgi:hypothetical protein